MLYICFIAFLLPSALSYSIKVKGTVELGDQVAAVINELKDHLLAQVDQYNTNQARDQTYSFPVAQKSDGMPAPQDFSMMGNIPFVERQPQSGVQLVDRVEVPLLEEIVNRKQEKVHVYGKHAMVSGRNNEPLNDITV